MTDHTVHTVHFISIVQNIIYSRHNSDRMQFVPDDAYHCTVSLNFLQRPTYCQKLSVSKCFMFLRHVLAFCNKTTFILHYVCGAIPSVL